MREQDLTRLLVTALFALTIELLCPGATTAAVAERFCELFDDWRLLLEPRRDQRNDEPMYAADGRPIWRKRELVWATIPYDEQSYDAKGSARFPTVPLRDVKRLLRLAFSAWADLVHGSRLRIREARDTREANEADIKLGFYRGEHGCRTAFDGPHSVLGHAYSPPLGRVHFDADEPWEFDYARRNATPGTVPFYPVALHEIGHALGLSHSDDEDGVMYPWHRSDEHYARPSLSEVERVREYYRPIRATVDDDDDDVGQHPRPDVTRRNAAADPPLTTTTTPATTATPLTTEGVPRRRHGRRRKVTATGSSATTRTAAATGSDGTTTTTTPAADDLLARQTIVLRGQTLLLRDDGDYLRFDERGEYVGRSSLLALFEPTSSSKAKWSRTNAIVEYPDGKVAVIADSSRLFVFDETLRLLPGYPRRLRVQPDDLCADAKPRTFGRPYGFRRRSSWAQQQQQRRWNVALSPWPGTRLRLLSVVGGNDVSRSRHHENENRDTSQPSVLLASERGVWRFDRRTASLSRAYAGDSCGREQGTKVGAIGSGSASSFGGWYAVSRSRGHGFALLVATSLSSAWLRARW